uniref:U58-Liphistoxin-Lth1a_1 n=1 Tax=Liphistius thaleban TaxID=1905330 RepID=A0A4Q8K305_9ARAC
MIMEKFPFVVMLFVICAPSSGENQLGKKTKTFRSQDSLEKHPQHGMLLLSGDALSESSPLSETVSWSVFEKNRFRRQVANIRDPYHSGIPIPFPLLVSVTCQPPPGSRCCEGYAYDEAATRCRQLRT